MLQKLETVLKNRKELYMLQKLETVLKNRKEYQLEECVIDSLMMLECDRISCDGCQYTLCDIDNENMICEIDLIDDLYGVV